MSITILTTLGEEFYVRHSITHNGTSFVNLSKNHTISTGDFVDVVKDVLGGAEESFTIKDESDCVIEIEKATLFGKMYVQVRSSKEQAVISIEQLIFAVEHIMENVGLLHKDDPRQDLVRFCRDIDPEDIDDAALQYLLRALRCAHSVPSGICQHPVGTGRSNDLYAVDFDGIRDTA